MPEKVKTKKGIEALQNFHNVYCSTQDCNKCPIWIKVYGLFTDCHIMNADVVGMFETFRG